GAVIPFALLAGYEIWARSRKEVTHDYTHYKEEQLRIANQPEEETGEESSEAQNRYGLLVLARTMAITSMIFIALALFADYKALWITLSVGVIVGVGSWSIYRYTKK